MVSVIIVMEKLLSALLQRASTSVIRLLSEVCVMPMRTFVSCFRELSISVSILPYKALILRAYFKTISPSGVSIKLPFPRTNRVTPSSSSSWLMWWLTAGWVREREAAAFVKFCYSATAKSVSIFEPSIDPPIKKNYHTQK